MDKQLNTKIQAIALLILDVDGVFTNGQFWLGPEGQEYKCFNTQDGLGIKRLQNSGVPVALISGRGGHVVEQYAKHLGIEHTDLHCSDKIAHYETLKAKTGFTDTQCAYAGDDLQDIPLLERVGFSVAVDNAVAPVKQVADWTTTKRGGEGAVRELCELILSVQGSTE